MADGSFDWGDYDNDGDLDLIVVGFDPSFNTQATIYNNTGGVFTDIGAGFSGVFFSTAEWGDYDNDGDLDVVVAGVDDTGTVRTTTLYQNNGGVFTDVGAGLQGVDYAALDWGDYDNDGDLDLVVMGRYANPSFGSDLVSSTIYQNNGGFFTDIGAGLQPLNNGSVDWGDYDADGDLDLVMTGFDADFVNTFTIIYDNDGGVFTDHLAGLPNVAWGDTDWGDYDNDGDLDLLLLGDGPGITITSIFNNAGGTFTDIGAGLPTTSEGSTRWGDFDGDGDLDLIITGNDYSTSTEITHIFRNDGGNVFTNINAGLQTVYFTGLADWGDFDGDGDLDVLVAGESTSSPSSTLAVLYENTIFNSFITTWKTDNPGSSGNNQITIPTNGGGYFYTINWGDGNTDFDVTGDITHTYATPGTYTVSITGAFPRIFFNAGFTFSSQKDSDKILSVEQWGDIAWTSMNNAFAGCDNLRINAVDAPDLSGVTDLSRMFFHAISMNDDISGWNVGSVINMSGMCRDAESFNQPLDSWNVGSATNMSEMFYFASAFNQDLNNWQVDNVTNMSSMFGGAITFNGNLSSWHVDNVQSMNQMFSVAEAFNGDISGWQITNVTNLGGMFNGAISFNQDISTKIGGGNNGGDAWNTNGVLNMSGLFRRAIAFNQPITNWDVSTVTDMDDMFSDHPTFNQNIAGWVVNNVQEMRSMFENATSFNQNISGWNVSKVNDFNGMFANATSFNQPIGSWTLNSVSNIDMRNMFAGATAFDQDLSGWDVSKLTLAVNMLNSSGLSVANYDLLLEGWAAQLPLNSVNFGAQGLFYCSAEAARAALIAGGWFITDGGSKCISVFNGPGLLDPEILDGQTEAIDFGSTATTKSRTFTILNNQGSPITNVVVAITGTAFSASPTPVTIGAGGTHNFNIDLSGATGTFLETVSITSDNFTGSFQFDLAGVVTASPEPEIKVFEGPTVLGSEITSSSTLDFGIENRGTDVIQEITITNLGSADLNISNIFTTGAFSVISATSLVIPADGTEVVQIQLSGPTGGAFLKP